jgi:ribosome-binding ATPase YchF (GTP1/OBG family)
VLTTLETGLDAGTPMLALGLPAADTALIAHLCLLTAKPTIFACNVKDSDLATADGNRLRGPGSRLRRHPPVL